jgi:hypothetical protein
VTSQRAYPMALPKKERWKERRSATLLLVQSFFSSSKKRVSLLLSYSHFLFRPPTHTPSRLLSPRAPHVCLDVRRRRGPPCPGTVHLRKIDEPI